MKQVFILKLKILYNRSHNIQINSISHNKPHFAIRERISNNAGLLTWPAHNFGHLYSRKFIDSFWSQV